MVGDGAIGYLHVQQQPQAAHTETESIVVLQFHY